MTSGRRSLDVACLVHVPFEGPGTIELWAASRGHTFRVHELYDDSAAHPGHADLVVVMGGPMSAHDEQEHPFLAEEKRYLSRLVAGDTLVLGVCLGAQLLAAACGGRVTRGAHTEIGWYPVEASPQGVEHRVFGALPHRFEPLHWHADTFSMPPGAVQLARSEGCEHQAFALDDGRVLGLQFHLECTRASLATLIEHASDDLVDGAWISSAEEMLADETRFTRSSELLFAVLDAMVAGRAGR